MLSRMTHVVLVVAVIVLSIALVRQSRTSSPAPVEGAISDLRATPASATMLDDDFDFLAGTLPLEALARGGDDESAPDLVALVAAAPRATPVDGPAPPPDRPHTRGDGPRIPGDDHQRMRRPMSPEVFARCLEVAREVDPELAQRLEDASRKNPGELERTMRQGGFGRRLLAMAELKEREPELYQAKIGELSQAIQIERTAKHLREARAKPDASLGEVDALEAQLRSLLQIQLAMSLKARGDMLCRLRERIEELEKQIDRDAQSFNEIIDARMKLLTSDQFPPPGDPGRDAGKNNAAQPVSNAPASPHG